MSKRKEMGCLEIMFLVSTLNISVKMKNASVLFMKGIL